MPEPAKPAAPAESPENAPREVPLSYPGVWPEASCLVTSEFVLAIRPAPAQRASSAWVTWCEGLQTSAGWGDGDEPILRDVLTALNAAPMSQRVPVLAIGSNASVAQLRHKARSQHFPLLIPMFRAEVTGLAIGHATVLSHLGYVPATLRLEPTAQESLFVQFLDRRQLHELDATEIGYRRIWLGADQVQIRLPSGETLGGGYAYAADGGYLAEAGRMILLRSQREIIELVRNASSRLGELLGHSVDDAVALARGSGPEWRAEVTSELSRAGLVNGLDQLTEYPDQRGRSARSYGTIPGWGGIDGRPELWPSGTITVAPTPDDLDRRGESAVAVSDELLNELGNPSHVLVRGYANHDQETHYRLGAVAVVRRISDATDAGLFTAPAMGGPPCAEVDESLRIALGLDLGDSAILSPARVGRRTWPDLLLGTPNHAILRVNLADTSTTERPVCLVSELTLELLGISSGDNVILEGFPEAGGRVPSVTLKAFRAPSEVIESRHALMGGSWGGRFPSPRDTFGIDPDVPEVYLDAATRHQLGLGAQQMGIVRARASRLQRFVSELRDLLLILILAAVGLIGIVDDPGWTLILLLVLAAGALLVTLVRMRDRLSHARSLHRAYREAATEQELSRRPRR